MKTVLNNSGWYIIPRKQISFDELVQIRQDLFNIIPWTSSKKYKSKIGVDIIKESKSYIYVPRNYGIERFGFPTSFDLYFGSKMSTIHNSSISLRKTQLDVYKVLMSAYQKKKLGGLVVLPTGFGKTLTSLYFANKIFGKTLIVVEYKTLAAQWISEIKKIFPDIKNVPIISKNKKKDFNKKVREQIKKNDFVICILKSLTMQKFSFKHFKHIRLVILDEVHNFISRESLKIFSKVSRRFILGLTATPDKLNNLHYMYKYFIGDILFKKDPTELKEAKTIFANYKPPNKSKYRKIIVRIDKSIDYMKTRKLIISDPKREEIIVKLIKMLSNNPNIGTLIVICTFRSEIDSLYSKIIQFEPKCCKYYSVTLKKDKIEREKRLIESKIILAVFKLGKEGLNILKSNSVLVLHDMFIHKNSDGEWHTKTMDQIIGRVYRKQNISPFLIFFNDNFGFYRKHVALKKIYFKQIKKWKIKEISLSRYDESTFFDLFQSALN